MHKHLIWKEWREQWLAGLVLAFAATLLIISLDRAFVREQLLPVSALVYGVLVGSMLLASDRENQTLDWLTYQAGSRWQLWRNKATLGAGLATAMGLLLLVIAWVRIRFIRDTDGSTFQPWTLFMVLQILVNGWLGLGCAMAAASRHGSVMRAIIVGAIGYLLIWAVLCLIAFYLGDAWLILLQTAVAGGLLVWSWRQYGWLDRQRRLTEKRAPRHSATWSLLWLWWRQVRWSFWLLPSLAFALGLLLLPQSWVIGWVSAAAVVGMACGWLVWLPDQAQGRFFMAMQRWPLGRIAFMRQCCSLLLAGLCFLCLCFGYTSRFQMQLEQQLPHNVISYTHFSTLLSECLLMLVLGWSLAQWVSLWTEKLITALVLSLGLLAGLLIIWMPTLVSMACTTYSQDWRLILILSLESLWLLMLGRLWAPKWGRQLQQSWRQRGLAAVGVLLLAGLSAGYFAYRASEPPVIQMPTGLATFNDPPGLERADPKWVISNRYDEMQKRIELKDMSLILKLNSRLSVVEAMRDEVIHLLHPNPDISRELFSYSWLIGGIQLVPYSGTNDLLKEDARFLNQWRAYLQNPDIAPISLDRLSFAEQMQRTQSWSSWAAYQGLRAFDLALEGNYQVGWEYIRIGMDMAHRMRQHGGVADAYCAAVIERQMMLAIYLFWLNQPLPDEALAKAWQDLQMWEKRVPSPQLALQRTVHRLLSENQWRDLWVDHQLYEMLSGGQRSRTMMHTWEILLTQQALQAPWEMERIQRDLRIVTMAQYLMEKEDAPERHRPMPWFSMDNKTIDPRLALTIPLAGQQSASLESLLPYIREGFIRGGHRLLSIVELEPNIKAWYRSLQLLMALRRYELKNGQQAEKLEQLVPTYLPALPMNPYTKQPFVYVLPKEVAINVANPHHSELSIRGMLGFEIPPFQDETKATAVQSRHVRPRNNFMFYVTQAKPIYPKH